jgi:hypothetical protein
MKVTSYLGTFGRLFAQLENTITAIARVLG